jgi:hypothetical protein
MLCHGSPADSESVFESRVSDSHLPWQSNPSNAHSSSCLCLLWVLLAVPTFAASGRLQHNIR